METHGTKPFHESVRDLGKTIDKVDARIIGLLQKDGRMPNSTIAKKLGISEATVRNRIQRLIGNETIQVVAVGDPFKLAFGVSGYCKMAVDTKKIDQVIEELKNISEVWYIALATGGTDLDIEFNTKSLKDLHVFLYERVNKIDGVIRTDTTPTIHFIKRSYEWGTGLDEEIPT
jgi:Lrp/AsnC family transcriptional regulator for asnA, asnC and gidA